MEARLRVELERQYYELKAQYGHDVSASFHLNFQNLNTFIFISFFNLWTNELWHEITNVFVVGLIGIGWLFNFNIMVQSFLFLESMIRD